MYGVAQKYWTFEIPGPGKEVGIFGRGAWVYARESDADPVRDLRLRLRHLHLSQTAAVAPRRLP